MAITKKSLISSSSPVAKSNTTHFVKSGIPAAAEKLVAAKTLTGKGILA